MAMAENADGVEEVVVERLNLGMMDVDGDDGFEEAKGVGECRGGEQSNERKTENGDAKVEKALEEDLVVHESENLLEALELPSQYDNGATVRNGPLQHTTVCLVEDVQESAVGEGVQPAPEVDGEPVIEDREINREGDSVDVIHQREGEAGPERIGFLVADANSADIGPSLHVEDLYVEVNGVSLDGDLKHTKCGEEEFSDENYVPIEKYVGSIDNCVQVSATETQTSLPDIDEKVGDAWSQLPEDVLTRIGKRNESEFHSTTPEEELKGTNHSENFSMGVEKSNIYGSVKSSAEEVEITEGKYGDGALVKQEEKEAKQKEVEVGLMSAVHVDQQFDSPDEVEGNNSSEEESSNLNVTEEFPRVHAEEASETSSDEELVPSIQSRSIEELLHKYVVHSTIASEKSSETTLIRSSSESSTGLSLHPGRPAGLGSSGPSLEPISRAYQQAQANEIVTSCSSQDLATDNKRYQVEGSSPHETAQPGSHCGSNSSEHVKNKSSQPLKLDELSQTEAHEKPGAAMSKSGVESIGRSTTESSSGSVPPPRPAGLGSSAALLERAPRSQPQARVSGTATQLQSQVAEETINGEADEDSETREKLQMIRVKFLRLAHRLGQTPHNHVVAQVLYRLGLAEQLRGSRAGGFSFDRASAMAEQLEAAGQDALDFSCTIMVLGKTGVGKSATINSIFDEAKFSTNAFQIGTKNVQAVTGTVQGIKVRVIDTPGLLSSFLDQQHNEKILRSVKNFIKRTPPDIVLYLDRLDMQSRDYGDLPLLCTITDIFGPSIWFNAIVVLTHAASAPPEGSNGTLSYETFVAQRSHVVQQAIRQAAGDMRLMNPVSLVENHSACRMNRAGQRVLPNGQVWKPHLLLLSFASKILSEANALLKLQSNAPAKPFGMRSRVPPLPFLLSSLLQSRPQLRLPEEQLGDEDENLDDSSDSEDEDAYDELPPFKCLSKQQISKLSKEQQKAYFDELDYREKLFMKKQLKEERKRRKLLKKMAASTKHGISEFNENMEEESGGPATVPVPMPDMALPASFDSDNPTHRYRYLDNSNQWLVRPVFESHGWDHDVGYEGLNVERLFVVKDKVSISISGQVTKDKKESSLQLECASSIKHGEGKATSLGFDMQTVGKDIAYTLRSETRFSNYRRNKAAAGLSVTLLGDALSAGLKFEDKLMIHKRLKVIMTGGAMAGKSDVAYGGSLEATLRGKDYPIGRSLSTFGLSIMDWHGDLAIGCNLQSQFPVGRSMNMTARASLNNRGSGQVSVRLNSLDQLQIALVILLPLLRNTINNRFNSQSVP